MYQIPNLLGDENCQHVHNFVILFSGQENSVRIRGALMYAFNICKEVYLAKLIKHLTDAE